MNFPHFNPDVARHFGLNNNSRLSQSKTETEAKECGENE
jgi:hypothetical protein